jgi:hypothetical protein
VVKNGVTRQRVPGHEIYHIQSQVHLRKYVLECQSAELHRRKVSFWLHRSHMMR